jgi:hypothetical protein
VVKKDGGQSNESAPAGTISKFEIGVKDLELQRWETLLMEYRDRCAIVNSRRLPVAKENMPQSTATVSTYKHLEAIHAILVFFGYANDRRDGCRVLGYWKRTSREQH